jgi:hypothetical protein
MPVAGFIDNLAEAGADLLGSRGSPRYFKDIESLSVKFRKIR